MFGLIVQWVATPARNPRLFRNFVRQDFLGQFSAATAGAFWLFITPILHILIYSFVFSYIFRLREIAEFGEAQFVIFLIIGYLPWFACAEAVSKSTNLLLEKAPLITKVVFPVQIIPVVGTLVPYLTHGVGFGMLLAYMALTGHLSWAWLLLPLVFALQFLFTMGLVAVLSALCVFLRDLQQIVSLAVTLWFFLTPIIYPITLIESEFIRGLYLLNPMHSFINLYREIILLGEFSAPQLGIACASALASWLLGGWLFMRIRHAFGDVL
ncbi:MAG: ABC transporter permease [Gammaproteobacteria bacterium]|nr:ABC transporter permease [Gammaproteobacteria bacterium]